MENEVQMRWCPTCSLKTFWLGSKTFIKGARIYSWICEECGRIDSTLVKHPGVTDRELRDAWRLYEYANKDRKFGHPESEKAKAAFERYCDIRQKWIAMGGNEDLIHEVLNPLPTPQVENER